MACTSLSSLIGRGWYRRTPMGPWPPLSPHYAFAQPVRMVFLVLRCEVIMKFAKLIAGVVLVSTPLAANDWEKFYTPLIPQGEYEPSLAEPVIVQSSGNWDSDFDAMWRKGFTAIGYSNFNSSNAKTKDALKLAKKLKAHHVIVATALVSSNSTSIPITTPTSNTAYSSGTASAYGAGGSVTGSYSGTTTTYGSSTTYIPITVNRFDKAAVYFTVVPKKGVGIQWRDLSDAETARLETRRARAILSVRDGSPGYNADLLPGDIILKLNGQVFDEASWWPAVANGSMTLSIDRNGRPREITVSIPPEWRD
jgi:hypothetical protein